MCADPTDGRRSRLDEPRAHKDDASGRRPKHEPRSGSNAPNTGLAAHAAGAASDTIAILETVLVWATLQARRLSISASGPTGTGTSNSGGNGSTSVHWVDNHKPPKREQRDTHATHTSGRAGAHGHGRTTTRRGTAGTECQNKGDQVPKSGRRSAKIREPSAKIWETECQSYGDQVPTLGGPSAKIKRT